MKTKQSMRTKQSIRELLEELSNVYGTGTFSACFSYNCASCKNYEWGPRLVIFKHGCLDLDDNYPWDLEKVGWRKIDGKWHCRSCLAVGESDEI